MRRKPLVFLTSEMPDGAAATRIGSTSFLAIFISVLPSAVLIVLSSVLQQKLFFCVTPSFITVPLLESNIQIELKAFYYCEIKL